MCVCFFSLSPAVTTAFLVWRQSCCWRKRVREETCSCGLGATETPMLSPQDRRITMGNYTHTQGPMYTVTINGSAYLNMDCPIWNVRLWTLDSGLLGHFGFCMFFFLYWSCVFTHSDISRCSVPLPVCLFQCCVQTLPSEPKRERRLWHCSWKSREC